MRGQRAAALAERGGELVVPRAGERDGLVLEGAHGDVRQAFGGVHGEVHAHALALVEHVVRLDPGRLEALPQQRGDPRDELLAVARPRQREDDRGAAAVGVAAAEQADLVGALEPDQRDDRAAQVVDRRGEQLLLRERVEERDGGLVVVRALDQVLGVERLAQLAVQQRRLRRALGVRLRREQPEQPRLADDLARSRHAAHADVVHPLLLVHRRDGVGLGDQQQVAARRALAHAGRELRQRHGGRERRPLLVAQDPEAGVGDDADALLGDVVLARAEQHEVALEQPLEEVGDLVNLVARVAGRAGAGDGDHVVDALGHRLEVGHDLAHGDERLADGVLDLLELLVVQPCARGRSA